MTKLFTRRGTPHSRRRGSGAGGDRYGARRRARRRRQRPAAHLRLHVAGDPRHSRLHRRHRHQRPGDPRLGPAANIATDRDGHGPGDRRRALADGPGDRSRRHCHRDGHGRHVAPRQTHPGDPEDASPAGAGDDDDPGRHRTERVHHRRCSRHDHPLGRRRLHRDHRRLQRDGDGSDPYDVHLPPRAGPEPRSSTRSASSRRRPPSRSPCSSRPSSTASKPTVTAVVASSAGKKKPAGTVEFTFDGTTIKVEVKGGKAKADLPAGAGPGDAAGDGRRSRRPTRTSRPAPRPRPSPSCATRRRRGDRGLPRRSATGWSARRWSWPSTAPR